METSPTFQGALTSLTNARVMAPMYFILSGKGRYEGAVIAKDLGDEHLADTPQVRQLSEANGTWYLLQTNDDVNKLPEDPRRPTTKLMLASVNQTQVGGGQNCGPFLGTLNIKRDHNFDNHPGGPSLCLEAHP